MDLSPLNRVLDYLDGVLFCQVTVLYATKDGKRMCRVINQGIELSSITLDVLYSVEPFTCLCCTHRLTQPS